MQIIVLQSRLNAKSLTLTTRHLLLAALLFVVAVIGTALLLYYLTFRNASDLDIPVLRRILASAAQDDLSRQNKFVKDNLAAMAVRLGEMQAQLMRLDALGERVQGLAGIKPQEFNFKQPPGRGGPEPTGASEQPLSMREFQQALQVMARDVERRSDYMNVVETTLMNVKMKSRLLPTSKPVVNFSYNASSFGWRIDPFTGQKAFHEGIDFAAPVGTPILAAAGGVVIAAEWHHDYGNMVEIDHGNDIITRYGHTSRLFVKVGDIVRRGQHIADVGSTGRSTGPHLHFEVRIKDVAQDPRKFLQAGADLAKVAALTSH